MIDINVKRLNPNATIPTYGTPDSAGLDLYACIDKSITMNCDETVKIPTGIAIEIPKGYVGLVFARSSLAIKNGLSPINKVGVIDADYRGEIIVALHKDESFIYDEQKIGGYSQSLGGYSAIYPKERIAQLVIVPYLTVNLNEVDELNDTQRGDGGFGSTGA